MKQQTVKAQDEDKYKIFEGDRSDLIGTASGRHVSKAVLVAWYLKIKSDVASGQPSTESFSWGAAGFGANTQPTVTVEGGLIIVVCRSSNSPAFLRAQFKPGGK